MGKKWLSSYKEIDWKKHNMKYSNMAHLCDHFKYYYDANALNDCKAGVFLLK